MSNTSTAEIVTMGVDGTRQAIDTAVETAIGTVVGTGMLLAEGLMWCGKKMKQNYEDACQSFNTLAENELAAQRAHPEDRRQVLTTMIEQFTASSHLQMVPNQDTAVLQQQEQAVVADMLRRAQSALTSDEQAKRLKMEQERDQWQQTLRNEITASQGIVPIDKIAMATAALQGTPQDMRTACQTLTAQRQQALQSITDTNVLRANQEKQARNLLEQAKKELAVVNSLLLQSYGQVDQRFADQVRGIEHRLRLAQQRVENATTSYDPQRALSDVQEAQHNLQRFKEQVVSTVTDELDQRETQRLEAQGRLTALERMVTEALQGRVITAKAGNDLTQRIDSLRTNLNQVDISKAANTLMQQAKRIDTLKDEVFRAIGTGQQEEVGETIAETLRELGFYNDPDTQTTPHIEMSGPSMRVTARKSEHRAQDEAATDREKLVTFTVDRDGGVSYDFSGYVGEECISAGEEVFAALKKKGITILDHEDAERVNQAPVGALTPEMLVNSPLAPHMRVNKEQAKLGKTILHVLHVKMGFKQVFESASEGSIIIEATNGDIGYHITLTREGQASLLRNGEHVLMDDASDILIHQLNEATGPVEELESPGVMELPEKISPPKEIPYDPQKLSEGQQY